ncbi:DUF995 domain-containing protein [Primorskyibacter sp. S87]|uniref:DUF995 domain-containing protein n=1 Tax=Primorskyibacter sp. S87 TaxID=3415126 RepID=UPI003C7BDF2F
MKGLLTFLVSAGLSFSSAVSVSADPKPKGATGASAQAVANLYGGMTQTWKTCQGGIYYGPNWEAQAWCGKNPDNVGIGKWRVDNKGRVCHDLTWYWPNSDGYGSKQDGGECISHVTDAEGNLWRSWPQDSEWWRATGSKSLNKGFTYKSKVRRAKRKMKL